MTVSVLPMFHIFAMNVTIGPVLYNGGKMVVLPKFEPQTFLAALEKYKVRDQTQSAQVPKMTLNVYYTKFVQLCRLKQVF